MSEIRQFWDSQKASSVPYPTGSVLTLPYIPFNDSLQWPGFLRCDGSWLLRLDYPDLYAVMGDKYGTDGSLNFRLPDYRGIFLRHVSGGSAQDPDRNDRSLDPVVTGNQVGSKQGEQIAYHRHWARFDNNDDGHIDGWADDNRYGYATWHTEYTGSHTRPKNFAMVYIIKY